MNIEQPNSNTRPGRLDKGMAQTLTTQNEECVIEPFAIDEQNSCIRKDGTVGTLTTDGSSPKHNNRVCDGYRIRKLTPKECFRLMDFDDEDIDKCRAVGMSDSQLYKQAGNSICVCVLEAIFGQLFDKE